MLKRFVVGAAVIAVMAVSGCASKGAKDTYAGTPLPPSSGQDSGQTESPIRTAPVDPNEGATTFNPLRENISQRTIYFDFDSSALSAQGQEVIRKIGPYLAENPSVRVRLEGNTDERGTREYNIGLGERRAMTVQAALLSMGASQGQMSVVSYGEEKPAALGHDESAWALNRRVVISAP